MSAALGVPLSQDGVGFLLEEDGCATAGVLFDGWNGSSICMHVAAVPGKRWMTREYLRVCFDYPFRQLQASKILGLVGEKNVAARRFDEHLGFVLEATLKDAHPDGDLLVYTMTPGQCRWLNMRTPQHGKERATAAA